jgi:dihydroxyacetone kinase DhaKLM complex PTS-EIIA-like component DhaM
MARVKEKAAKVKQLLADETFKAVMESVKNQQIAVFVDTGSSQEARESAHQIIRALGRIENYINSVLTDEKIFDKNNL